MSFGFPQFNCTLRDKEREREAWGTESLLETGDIFIRNIKVKKLIITTGGVFLPSEVYTNIFWVFR